MMAMLPLAAFAMCWDFNEDGMPRFAMSIKTTEPKPAPQKPRKREVKTKPTKGTK